MKLLVEIYDIIDKVVDKVTKYVRVPNKMETDTVDRFEKYTNTLNIPITNKLSYLEQKNSIQENIL